MTAGTLRTDRRAGPRWRALVAPGLSTLAAMAVLVGLGFWQVERLAWKEHLLSTIAARTKAPPVPLPPADAWPTLEPEAYAYRHVAATGTFDEAREIHVFRPLSETDAHGPAHGTGDLVLVPFRLANGGTVIVNRGFVPADRLDPATRAAGRIVGETTITGLMREPETRNSFTPSDDPATNQWFTRDPATIAAALTILDAAPFTIDQDAGQVPGGLPQGGETLVDIPNNHLSYALTWFGLALALLGVFAAYAWRKLRTEDLA